ncbi:hypothetical protein ACHQM5_003799 [Ranunculus cassubicifolius]
MLPHFIKHHFSFLPLISSAKSSKHSQSNDTFTHSRIYEKNIWTHDYVESLQCDVKGLLDLYEASHLCLEGENILHEAKEFTVKHLKLRRGNIDPDLAEEVNRALDLPLHWRMSRLEARHYIEVYQRKEDIDPSLPELAKVDFNALQATHQKELRNMSRWWKDLGLSDKLGTRDRLVESFLWSVGLTSQPQDRCCREWLTKVICLILTIDDICNIIGSLSELEIFTTAVEGWDFEAMELLPEYMKIYFSSLFNKTSDIVYRKKDKEHGFYMLPSLKKAWADFCKAMLVEAKWSKMGYIPSPREYLQNTWISSSVTVGLIHAFFATNQTIRNSVLESLDNNPDLIYYSAMVFRLCNDLATSPAELDRGDVSAIPCYMNEAKTSELIAQEKLKSLISDIWKKLNESLYDSAFEHSFVTICINNARTAHNIYQNGDGIGVQDHEARKRVARLLIEPISVNKSKSP